MRMLSDSSLAGVVDQGSTSATASHQWDWTASQAQAAMTPDGRITTGYDAHRCLILAALLCALVGAIISFNSLLQCAFHYCGGGRRRRSSALPPTAGLKKNALRRMPVEVYEASKTPGASSGGAECAICLGEFVDGDAVRLLPRCRHGFHVHCIDTWLSAHSSCPICRDSLLDEGATAAAAAGEGTAPSMFAAGMLILP